MGAGIVLHLRACKAHAQGEDEDEDEDEDEEDADEEDEDEEEGEEEHNRGVFELPKGWELKETRRPCLGAEGDNRIDRDFLGPHGERLRSFAAVERMIATNPGRYEKGGSGVFFGKVRRIS